MKLLYSILMVTLFITSCSGDKKQSVETIIASDNLEAMRLKRAELVGQQQNIAAQLKQLDDRIRVLDTVKNVPLVTTFKLKKRGV